MRGFENMVKNQRSHKTSITIDPLTAVFQTLLAADALRYLTLQITASKHLGILVDLRAKSKPMPLWSCWVTKHHYGSRASRPGFYSAMFLDTSLDYED